VDLPQNLHDRCLMDIQPGGELIPRTPRIVRIIPSGNFGGEKLLLECQQF